MNRDDVLRVRRFGFDLLPQARDVSVNRARVERGVFAPDVMQQLFARDGLATMCDEQLQYLELARAEVERHIDSAGAMPMP